MNAVTVEEALRRAFFFLKKAQIENPRQEAELLLAWSTGQKPLQLLLERGRMVPKEALAVFIKAVARRCKDEPLAYITGEKEFFGLAFAVNPHVLIPRPETEFVAEAALEWAEADNMFSSEGILALDLGTGSGALAITLACRLPKARVWAVDISEEALSVAAINADRHNVARQITWCPGNFFQALDPLYPKPRFNLIVGNPPYICSRDMTLLPSTIKDFEPALALDGGEDGLDGYRAIIRGLADYMLSPGLLALEIGAGQYQSVEKICRKAKLFHSVTFCRDYRGWPRVALAPF